MEHEKRSIDDYTRIMTDCLSAWNRADPELVASFYADELDYRDPTVPAGISTRKEFIAYLKLVFSVWPRQNWAPTHVMSHGKEGAFSIEYEFSIANDAATIRGSGMDRMEFTGGKISLNHVYLNADRWKVWIKRELTA